MRRLIAYLTLTFSIILGSALNAVTPLRNLVSNHEYQSGREFVYRLSDKENPDNVFTDSTAIDEVASMMDRRMQNFGVSEYNIAKEGNNIIRTTTTLQNDKQYNRLQVYLNYNANFTIRIGDDDNTEAQLEAEEVFENVTARVEYRGPYAFIVFPLSNPELFETNIVNVAEEIQNERGSSETPEGESRPTLVKEATIVMWSDFDPDKDSYLDPVGDSEGKIFLTFDYRSMWWNDDKTEIGVASPLEGADANGNYPTSAIKESSDTASYMANVFNAGVLDYKVEFLFSNKYINPSVEPIINLGNRDNLALSATLFASIITFLLVMVIAFAIYRLPIINALSSGLLTFIGTMIVFNAIQVEFSTSAIIGLLVVTLVSLLSTIFYSAKFRNEVYKGRSFKKAHNEAISRSSFMTIDIMVVMLITGVFGYFFGGAALAGFATSLIFGSIVMLVSVLVHNAVVLPLLAHNPVSSTTYSFYGINEAKVPNPLKDEKQTYFGRFVNHKPETRAKLHTIILSSLSGVTAVLLIVFGAFTQTNPYNLVKYNENTTRVYFQVSENSPITALSPTNNPLTLLSYIEIDGETLEVMTKDGNPIVETHEFTTLETSGEDEIEVKYVFYVYDLVGIYTGNEEVQYKATATDTMTNGTLSSAIENIVGQLDDKAVVSFNDVRKEAITPHYGRIAWVALVTLAVTSLYMGIRYGLGRGLTTFVESFVGASLVLLFFMIVRLAIPPLATMGAFVAVILVSILNIIIFSQTKEIQKDQAHRDLTYREKFDLGHRSSLSIIYVTSLVFALAFTIFTLLGPIAVSSVYLASVVAVVVALVAVSKFNTILQSALLNLFSTMPKHRRERKASKHQRTSIKSKSGEPEEAVFIGIND